MAKHHDVPPHFSVGYGGNPGYRWGLAPQRCRQDMNQPPDILGLPRQTLSHRGIDRLGGDCRVAGSVTVYRFEGTEGEHIVLDNGVRLHEGVRLVIGDPDQHPRTGIRLGARVVVNAYSYLSGEGGLDIEEGVLVGPHCCILSAGHQVDHGDEYIRNNPLTHGPIRIEAGAWIGAAATLLEGVTIGRGAVVGAGSVVTRSVPPFAIVAGNPARLIRYRQGFEPAQDGLEDLRGWWRRLLGKRRR
jgi:acetyltransferase-like isoleucine patch superfamily enzyme